MKHAAASAYIRELCSLGLSNELLVPALYHEIWRPQRLHFRHEAIVRDADGDRRAAQVNLDSNGRIVHLSRDAHKVLLLAHGDISPATAANPPSTREFPTLGVLHRQVSRRGRAPVSPCVLTLANAWGRFDFRAERLESVDPQGPGLVGVTIQHLVPREVRDLNAIEAHPLSIAQKKVCALLMHGCPQPEIAARLGVSRSTVTDHVRKIYDKLDVHSVENSGPGSSRTVPPRRAAETGPGSQADGGSRYGVRTSTRTATVPRARNPIRS